MRPQRRAAKGTFPCSYQRPRDNRDDCEAKGESILTKTFVPCSDAFQRREKANEDYTIRQREKEKLLALRKQLNEQREHLDRLAEHMYVDKPCQ